MESVKLGQKHDVVTGNLINGKMDRQFWAGEAFYYPDEDYFKVRLAIFPFYYYLTRNRDSEDAYTVWAQKVNDVIPALFRRPIGKAFVADNLKTHLEIQIPLLNLRFNPYLSLFPAK